MHIHNSISSNYHGALELPFLWACFTIPDLTTSTAGKLRAVYKSNFVFYLQQFVIPYKDMESPPRGALLCRDTKAVFGKNPSDGRTAVPTVHGKYPLWGWKHPKEGGTECALGSLRGIATLSPWPAAAPEEEEECTRVGRATGTHCRGWVTQGQALKITAPR